MALAKRAAGIAILFAMGAAADEPAAAELERLRERMVAEQIEARGIAAPAVLAAMRRVPRHVFAPDVEPAEAYQDEPQPIGHRQTISQPYIVALMTELAELRGDSRVLEIGTGSGYQAAIAAEIAAQVYTIEIVEPLAKQATRVLASYPNVQVRHGDGYQGWPEAAPFDAILVTAAAPRLPQPLVEQLAEGGRLVIPVDASEDERAFGLASQWLEVHRKTAKGLERERKVPVRFVPMTGEVRRER